MGENTTLGISEHKAEFTPGGSESRKPFFSVLIPAYNQADYLCEALNTLKAQTFGDWEALIVNDGSTDHTEEVALRYNALDSRIKYFKKANGGCGSALNEGLRHVSGEWICWLSSDDFFEPDKLENHVKAIQANPGIKFFYSLWYVLIEETGQKLPQNLRYPAPGKEYQVFDFFKINYVHGNSFAMHHTIPEKVGNFNIELKQGQDFDMWLRVSSLFETRFMPIRTCTTRLHAAQTTNQFPEGGTFDSTRSLFEFTNAHTFRDIFPFCNLNDLEVFIKIFHDIITVTCNKDNFVNRLGWNSLLIDKALDFATHFYSPNERKHLQEAFNERIALMDQYVTLPALRTILLKINFLEPFEFHPIDCIELAREEANTIAKSGYQKKCLIYERFIFNATGGKDNRLLFYSPEVINEAPLLPVSNVLLWKTKSVSTKKNLIAHSVQITCPECNNDYLYYTEMEFSPKTSEEFFRCPSCKKPFTFSDSLIEKYWQQKAQLPLNTETTPETHIGFIIPTADYLGGGTKVVFQYIQWLEEAGIRCTVLTQTDGPDWLALKTPFIKFTDLAGIDFAPFSHIVTFSVFEILELLSYVHISKLIHLCQGYQGYHYGTTYEILRADKYVFDVLHSIPVTLLVVSKHLQDLFKSRFGRESWYINNFVDTNIFRPIPKVQKHPHSVLFVGTPDHLLKNYIFLVNSIQLLKQQYGIADTTIYLVTGHGQQLDIMIEAQLQEQTGITTKAFHHVAPEQIAYLMNAVNVVVCTSWYEGFGLPVLEAMACQVPVITTNTMGTESFCSDQNNAFVVPYPDIALFAHRLYQVFSADSILQAMAVKAQNTITEYSPLHAQENFSLAFSRILGKGIVIGRTNTKTPPEKFSREFLPASIFVTADSDFTHTAETLNNLLESSDETLDVTLLQGEQGNTEEDDIRLFQRKHFFHTIGHIEKQEAAFTLNDGLKSARYEFAIFCTSQVKFSRGCIKGIFSTFTKYPEIAALIPGVVSVQGASVEISEKLEKSFFNADPVFALRQSLISVVGGFDERFNSIEYLLYDYYLRAGIAGKTVCKSHDITVLGHTVKNTHAGSADFEKFTKKWGAAPEQIFTGKANPQKRSIYIPLHFNRAKELLDRGQYLIADNDYYWAHSCYTVALKLIQTGSGSFTPAEVAKISALTEKLQLLI